MRVIGRFISPDSIVPNPSDPRDHNRYSYVRNNPLKYTDPSGNWVICLCFSYSVNVSGAPSTTVTYGLVADQYNNFAFIVSTSFSESVGKGVTVDIFDVGPEDSVFQLQGSSSSEIVCFGIGYAGCFSWGESWSISGGYGAIAEASSAQSSTSLTILDQSDKEIGSKTLWSNIESSDDPIGLIKNLIEKETFRRAQPPAPSQPSVIVPGRGWKLVGSGDENDRPRFNPSEPYIPAIAGWMR